MNTNNKMKLTNSVLYFRRHGPEMKQDKKTESKFRKKTVERINSKLLAKYANNFWPLYLPMMLLLIFLTLTNCPTLPVHSFEQIVDMAQVESQQREQQQNQLASLNPEDSHIEQDNLQFTSASKSNSGLLLPTALAATSPLDNQSAFLLDYSANLDDDEQLLVNSDPMGQVQAGSRLLWRRQVLMSNDDPMLDVGQSQLLAGEPLNLDYDPYRPLDFSGPPKALHLASQELSPDGGVGSLDGTYSKRLNRLFIETNPQATTASSSQKHQGINNLIKSNGEQKQQQQQQQKMGPQFIKEPPSLIHYLNSSDLVIPCSATGNPQPAIVSILCM